MLHDALLVLTGLFLAGLLRGFTGFGLALAAVPLLALVLPPQQVVPVITTATILSGWMELSRRWRDADWGNVAWLAVAMAACTPIGFLALSLFRDNTVRLVIGLMVAGSVTVLWWGIRLPAHPSRPLTLAVGAVSGVMNGLAAMAGPPVVLYFLAQNRSTTVMRANLIAFFTFTGLAAIVPLLLSGLANRDTTIWTMIGLPGLLAGQYLGHMGFRRTQPSTHRRVALSVLAALSLVLIARALL